MPAASSAESQKLKPWNPESLKSDWVRSLGQQKSWTIHVNLQPRAFTSAKLGKVFAIEWELQVDTIRLNAEYVA